MTNNTAASYARQGNVIYHQHFNRPAVVNPNRRNRRIPNLIKFDAHVRIGDTVKFRQGANTGVMAEVIGYVSGSRGRRGNFIVWRVRTLGRPLTVIHEDGSMGLSATATVEESRISRTIIAKAESAGEGLCFPERWDRALRKAE